MTEEIAKAAPTIITNRPKDADESGVIGVLNAAGYIFDDFIQDLNGSRARKTYREMSDNDPTVGAILSAIRLMMQSAQWSAKAAEGDIEQRYSKWLEEQINGMAETWNDTIGEIASMLIYGFSLLEIVTKRNGDGTIGLKKLAPRAQETIFQWDMNDSGDIFGVLQTPKQGGINLYIEYSKLLHFRTLLNKGNPEGRSILRNCYVSYYYIKNLQRIEGNGIERDLSGVPVIFAPSSVTADKQKAEELVKIARDLKANSQGGIVLPSDVYNDSDGNPTTVRKYDVRLISAEGTGRANKVSEVISRHRREMATTALADFIMLGADGKGSFALSRNKTDMFLRSVESIMNVVKDVLNRKLVPTLWVLNGFPEDMAPQLYWDEIAPIDLEALGNYIDKLTGAGIMLNDPETEQALREFAGLPIPIEEGIGSTPVEENE